MLEELAEELLDGILYCPQCKMPAVPGLYPRLIDLGPSFDCGSIYSQSQRRLAIETAACKEIARLRKVVDAAIAEQITSNALTEPHKEK